MSEARRRVGEVRRDRSELENHLIDEYSAGRISRREFVRRGTIVGMSIPLVAWLAAACGGSSSSSSGGTAAGTGAANTAAGAPTTSAAPGKPGGTIRVGVDPAPAGSLNPVTVNDTGGICMNCQTGEFLSLNLADGKLTPVLAESWKPNADASQWTFAIRQGVTFNDDAQTPMTAKDVAASLNRLADPKNKSNALSVFQGLMKPGGAQATSDTSVVFELEGPNGNFPWLISSDNYNAIVIPESSDGSDWEKTFVGTGPWKLDSYTQKVSASFVRNESYWGDKALPDAAEFTFYADEAPAVLALKAKQVHTLLSLSVAGGRTIIDDPASFTVMKLHSANHRELSMRCDKDPFTDKRVRQAIALTLDRPSIVQGLFGGLSDLGNDNPFAPVFASTDTSVPQRAQDLEKAKQLLAAAGHPNGFSTQLNANKIGEIPQYAQIVQASAKKIGVDIKLVVQDISTYYGDAVFGKSPWLDSIMSLVDYGARGVPNVFLNAPLLSDGVWNAAHFKNPSYDKIAKDYLAEPDLQKQRALAGQIERLLLDETPIIYAYFFNLLIPTLKGVTGVAATTNGGQIFVNRATGIA